MERGPGWCYDAALLRKGGGHGGHIYARGYIGVWRHIGMTENYTETRCKGSSEYIFWFTGFQGSGVLHLAGQSAQAIVSYHLLYIDIYIYT